MSDMTIEPNEAVAKMNRIRLENAHTRKQRQELARGMLAAGYRYLDIVEAIKLKFGCGISSEYLTKMRKRKRKNMASASKRASAVKASTQPLVPVVPQTEPQMIDALKSSLALVRALSAMLEGKK
jgi:hypothetical protein